jgi:hypothetical protein
MRGALSRGRIRTGVGLVAAVAVVTAGAPAAGVAASPVKDPSGIACPPGPTGWSLSPAAGKTIWDGQHDERLAGLHQVAVNCNYVTSGFERHIEVTVSYALPTDPNPINDFAFGCSSGGVQWTARDRMFHVTSAKQWAMATFNDFLTQINDTEARAFQTVTRQLLANAEGYGHGCTLQVAPTTLKTEFTFDFKTAAGSGHGSFFTQGLVRRPTNSAPVVSVTAPNIALALDGTPRALVLDVTRGLSYHPTSPSSARKVRLAVRVVSSRLASCRSGATGTLTITAAPSVELRVCGRTLLQGRASAQILQR